MPDTTPYRPQEHVLILPVGTFKSTLASYNKILMKIRNMDINTNNINADNIDKKV